MFSCSIKFILESFVSFCLVIPSPDVFCFNWVFLIKSPLLPLTFPISLYAVLLPWPALWGSDDPFVGLQSTFLTVSPRAD